ncbi:MAG: sensor histidine kinase [Methylophilus sp.]|uniref:sensor histidine kinase n=1 Tax=Methylophilus sp. TaxID=29541 RepID=UPI002BB88113|nr:histidine kinase [Methylophilus sp.]HSH86504.1 histidine kinase [Methylophilus sp.]
MRKSNRIPNFRNLGIHLRLLLMHAGLLGLLTIYDGQPAWNIALWAGDLTQLAGQWLPPLLLTMGALTLLYALITRLPYVIGLAAIMALALVLTSLSAYIYHIGISPLTASQSLQILLLCVGDVALSLYYLDLLQRAYSPAIAEARLQALQARIRPHFLFNSLNAVLSLIRSQPQRAETALEDMAELFRVLMADNRALVPLAQEITLCQQYLSIEKLRLDERLQVEWHIAKIPSTLMIPPLILQPLVENAVYHGIETLAQGGTIVINISTSAQSLVLRISNPLSQRPEKSGGNKMALKNIGERLRLHYDLEARLRQYEEQGHYVVEITIPTRPLSEVPHG